MPMGFIQSELDLKLLVLYIMSRVAGPVTFLQLLELALCDEGVDYFSLTEAVGHMVETGQLERDQEQRYSITEKGRRNSEICESSLPYSVPDALRRESGPGERRHPPPGPGPGGRERQRGRHLHPPSAPG